jgi:hypothetical protein
MPESPDFRSWAARVAQQSTKERDSNEAQRLMSIAGYWERLADIEDWQRDGRTESEAGPHRRPS